MGLEGRAPKPITEQRPKVTKTPTEEALASNPAEEEFFQGTITSRAAEAQEEKDKENLKKLEQDFYGPDGMEGKKKAA